jgi:hypothetical protein
MISTLTGGGAGPIAGYLYVVPIDALRISMYSTRKNVLLPTVVTGTPSSDTITWYYYFSGIAASANHVVVTGSNGNTNLVVYSRSGNVLTSLNAPVLAGSTYELPYISTNGDYITVNGSFGSGGLPTGENTNFLIYHNNNGSFTRLARASGSQLQKAAMSHDGLFVATRGYNNSIYAVNFYKRIGSGNGASYSTLHQSLPTGSSMVTNMSFSRDGTYLAAQMNGSPFLKIFKYNSSTDSWSDLNQPPTGGTLPSSYSNAPIPVWSYDGNELYVGSNGFIYERSGDQFAYRGTVGADVSSIHPSGKYVAAFSGGTIYRRNSISSWSSFLTIPNVYRTGAFSPYI